MLAAPSMPPQFSAGLEGLPIGPNAGSCVWEVIAGSCGTITRAITEGIDQPYALTTDAAGNLYVRNHGNETITVYQPGRTTPTWTIAGLDQPHSDTLAVDRRGLVYVSTAGPGNAPPYAIVVYGLNPGHGPTLLRQITGSALHDT